MSRGQNFGIPGDLIGKCLVESKTEPQATSNSSSCRLWSAKDFIHCRAPLRMDLALERPSLSRPTKSPAAGTQALPSPKGVRLC
jgi:hypothetical protein